MPQRNVRCTVEIEMYIPDVKSAPVEDRFKDKPGYAAYAASQPDDETNDLVASLVHSIIEAGDPDDAYDMVVIVSTELIPDAESEG